MSSIHLNLQDFFIKPNLQPSRFKIDETFHNLPSELFHFTLQTVDSSTMLVLCKYHIWFMIDPCVCLCLMIVALLNISTIVSMIIVSSNFYNFSFCLKIPASGWLLVGFADIAVTNSDMSLFRNCKNIKKLDGLIPNDPRY